MLVLLAALTAAPALKSGATFNLALHTTEKLSVTYRGKVTPSDETFDAKARVRVESVNGARPDAVAVQSAHGEFPPVTVREDSGAPVLTYQGVEPSVGWRQLLRGALGQLVLEDPDRSAMAACGAETEGATRRWLSRALARLNASQLEEVSLTELEVKCAPAKPGTKIDIVFVASVPRATLTAVLHAKGTLTVDPALWVTQWRFAGPLHVSGTDEQQMVVDGTVSSSMTLAR